MILNLILKNLILVFFLSGNIFAQKQITSLKVMSYNLENFFDTVHDEGKTDWTYMPLNVKRKDKNILKKCLLFSEQYQFLCVYLDWSNHALEMKINQISKLIKDYAGSPDVIFFQEIENKKVLQMLVDQGLSNEGYKYVSLIEGEDERGIDVGIISKYPILKEQNHHIPLNGDIPNKTRPILEVRIEVLGNQVVLLNNHWPSQGNPVEDRITASIYLKNIINDIMTNSSVDFLIAGGDFNTIDKDKPHPFKFSLQEMVDVDTVARQINPWLNSGTFWYQNSWDKLDHFFIPRNLLKNNKSAQVLWESYDILINAEMTTNTKWTNPNSGEINIVDGIPKRFNEESGLGFSDHLPILMNVLFYSK